MEASAFHMILIHVYIISLLASTEILNELVSESLSLCSFTEYKKQIHWCQKDNASHTNTALDQLLFEQGCLKSNKQKQQQQHTSLHAPVKASRCVCVFGPFTGSCH